MKLSVIIPNWNGERLLRKNLAKILKAWPKGTEVIIVDDGSTDGSVELIKSLTSSRVNEWLKKKEKKEKNNNNKSNSLITNSLIKNRKITIKLIENKKNLGFAGAVNQGIKVAKNNYVAVMNNDLRLEKNWFLVMKNMIQKYPAEKKKIGTYFGTVLNWNGTKIESTGLQYWLKGRAKNRDNGKRLKYSTIQIFKRKKQEFVWGASASVVVYYKPALMEVGLFDEDFFAYEEDVDLALRLWGADWKTLYVPQAIAYHLGGGTSRRMGNFRQRMDAKNWWFIIIKNYPWSILIRYGPEILIERLRNLSGLLKSTPIWRWPIDVARVYGEVVLKLPKMIRKRKPIELGKLIINS